MYARQAELRALVNAIPFIGSAVDVLLATRGQAIATRRISELLEALRLEMACVAEKMVDQEFLGSEEWFDLIRQAMEATTRTRDNEKIRLYARLLRGAVVVQDRTSSSPEEYLAVLTELTVSDLQVARAIWEQQGNTAPDGEENELQWAWRVGWPRLHEGCPSVPEDDLQFILLRLRRAGLIHEFTGGFMGYEGGVYAITPAFRKLMRYISLPPTDG